MLTCWAAILALPACGGGSVAVQLRYEAIQTHESALERAIARGQSLREEIVHHGETPGACDDLARSLDDATHAAESVCETARGARDADAAVRCERARRRARDATAGWDRCSADAST